MGDRIGFQLPLREIYHSLTNHPGQLSLAIPLWVGAMSTGQRAVVLCDWGVKADMVLFAGNTVWSMSERVGGVCVDALYKSTFTLLYFTIFTSDCTETLWRPDSVVYARQDRLAGFKWWAPGNVKTEWKGREEGWTAQTFEMWLRHETSG